MKSDSFTPLFTELAPTVTALVSRRGFNLCHYVPGSDLAEVECCRHELAIRLGVGDDCLFVPTQTHSARVAMPGDDLDGVDAIVTDRRRQALVINTADCLPLLLVDPDAGVIGAAHCGWRGTVTEIAIRTLERMIDLGASADRICVAMGPCICTDCFEVGDEVASQFPEQAIVRRHGQKPHVDLARAVSLQLMEHGVTRITPPIACSMHTDTFYSVRRQGRTLPRRTATAIILN